MHVNGCVYVCVCERCSCVRVPGDISDMQTQHCNFFSISAFSPHCGFKLKSSSFCIANSAAKNNFPNRTFLCGKALLFNL